MIAQEELTKRRAALRQILNLTYDRFHPKQFPLWEEAESYLRVGINDEPNGSRNNFALVWKEAFEHLLTDSDAELPK